MIKKLGISFVISMLIIFSSVNLIFAKENQSPGTEKSKIIYEKSEIKDINKLLERAKNNVSDLNEDQNILQFEASLEENSKSNKEKIELKATSQLLKQTKKSDGTTISTYTTTIFTQDVSKNIGVLSQGSNRDLWDGSLSVRAYSTYTFDRYEANGYVYHDILSCSGGWQRSDSTVGMSNRIVTYGASGPRYSNDAFVQQSNTAYPSGNTFSYTAPSSWVPVKTSFSVGVSTWVTLSKGGSVWTLKLINQN